MNIFSHQLTYLHDTSPIPQSFLLATVHTVVGVAIHYATHTLTQMEKNTFEVLQGSSFSFEFPPSASSQRDINLSMFLTFTIIGTLIANVVYY